MAVNLNSSRSNVYLFQNNWNDIFSNQSAGSTLRGLSGGAVSENVLGQKAISNQAAKPSLAIEAAAGGSETARGISVFISIDLNAEKIDSTSNQTNEANLGSQQDARAKGIIKGGGSDGSGLRASNSLGQRADSAQSAEPEVSVSLSAETPRRSIFDSFFDITYKVRDVDVSTNQENRANLAGSQTAQAKSTITGIEMFAANSGLQQSTSSQSSNPVLRVSLFA